MSFIMSRTLRCCCARAVVAVLSVARAVMTTIKARMKCLPCTAPADFLRGCITFQRWHREAVRDVVPVLHAELVTEVNDRLTQSDQFTSIFSEQRRGGGGSQS